MGGGEGEGKEEGVFMKNISKLNKEGLVRALVQLELYPSSSQSMFTVMMWVVGVVREVGGGY